MPSSLKRDYKHRGKENNAQLVLFAETLNSAWSTSMAE